MVSSVNYLISGNSRRHRTDKYFLSMRPIHPQLIIRRGQPFDLRITFERKFRYGEDVLSLVFLVKGMRHTVNPSIANASTTSDEPNPSYSNRTEITVPVLDERNARRYSFLTESRWSARIVLTDGNSVTIEVNSSPEAIIGEYNLVIDTKSPTRIDDSFYSNPISQSFIMLFNPWSRGTEDDEVNAHVALSFSLLFDQTQVTPCSCLNGNLRKSTCSMTKALFGEAPTTR